MTNRNEKGKFVKGNKAAVGHKNKMAKKRQALTDDFLRQLRPCDFKKIIQTLIELAKNGDLPAIREVLDRALGKCQVSESEEEPLQITVLFPPELKDI